MTLETLGLLLATIVYPWLLIGFVPLLAGMVLLFTGYRVLGVLALALSAFPLWMGMHSGILYIIQISEIDASTEALLKSIPYVWTAVVLIGSIAWGLVGGVHTRKEKEE